MKFFVCFIFVNKADRIFKGKNMTNGKTAEEKVEGYCVKCKEKREMKDAQEVSMKGKGNVERRAMTGSCVVCGTKMFRILGKA